MNYDPSALQATLQDALTQMVNLISTYVPSLFGALLILVIGWLIALAVSALIAGVLKKTNLAHVIAQSVHSTDADAEKAVTSTVKSVVFYVLMLFVLIAFFQTLQLPLITEPLNNMLQQIFVYLPKILLALQHDIGYFGASAVAFIFFLLVFFAAITSLVSIVEVPTATLSDRKGISRKKALGILTLSTGVLTIMCIMSFGMIDSLTTFTSYGSGNKSFFDIVYDVFYDTILPLNGLMVCLFVMYKWKKVRLSEELRQGSPNYANSFMEKYVNFSLQTFIPAILLLIFVNTVATKFFNISIFGF